MDPPMIRMKIDICMKKSARIFYGEAMKNRTFFQNLARVQFITHYYPSQLRVVPRALIWILMMYLHQ